ncbi:phosphoglucosamine mutase [Coraliomargarita sp. SDUM461004]|uniref:Phosphoglucosamine mutase n=1 Tax=Thalassobacterium sedimentorum TaxID=3041258 RepID=A0ABU1AEH7_9BACT|nr:phosphoglucosamine mutase [Coraliomargarita sp. SDUM461004]MDQ8193049.1 phosphoglucosamine mutase [Coraliomargarita sp. SDUM461004]
MAKYFGTDGIRGRYGEPWMCPEFAYRLGCALGAYLQQLRPSGQLNLVIGRDTRSSGVALCDALTAGLNHYQIYVMDAAVVPTPAVARSVLERQADFGLAVTASHNPSCDNGIKLFDRNGCKLDDSQEHIIEGLLEAQPDAPLVLPAPKSCPFDSASFYVNYQRSLMDQGCLADWDIVLDLANGATVATSPAVFSRWGATLHLIGDQPDGLNINDGVGSECPQQLSEAVLQHAARIGIAHDGDGDRLVVCDETGTIVDGDVLLAILGCDAMRRGVLRADTLVATIHSNLGLDCALQELGARVERVGVGDRYVASRMRELGASLGGESSGHIIFSDYATTGDGLLAAIKLIELMCRTGKKLSELRQEIYLFPQATRNLRVHAKTPLAELKNLQSAIQEVESQLGKDGRVLVRYSGTEPKIRLLVEGRFEVEVTSALKSIETAARKDLSVIDS